MGCVPNLLNAVTSNGANACEVRGRILWVHNVYTTKSLLLLTLVGEASSEERKGRAWGQEESGQQSVLGHALPWASCLPKTPEFPSDKVLLLGDNEIAKYR